MSLTTSMPVFQCLAGMSVMYQVLSKLVAALR